jgi:hypothetical protein
MQGIFLVVTFFLVSVVNIMTEFEDEDNKIRNASSLWITRKNTEEDEIL